MPHRAIKARPALAEVTTDLTAVTVGIIVAAGFAWAIALAITLYGNFRAFDGDWAGMARAVAATLTVLCGITKAHQVMQRTQLRLAEATVVEMQGRVDALLEQIGGEPVRDLAEQRMRRLGEEFVAGPRPLPTNGRSPRPSPARDAR